MGLLGITFFWGPSRNRCILLCFLMLCVYWVHFPVGGRFGRKSFIFQWIVMPKLLLVGLCWFFFLLVQYYEKASFCKVFVAFWVTFCSRIFILFFGFLVSTVFPMVFVVFWSPDRCLGGHVSFVHRRSFWFDLGEVACAIPFVFLRALMRVLIRPVHNGHTKELIKGLNKPLI